MLECSLPSVLVKLKTVQTSPPSFAFTRHQKYLIQKYQDNQAGQRKTVNFYYVNELNNRSMETAFWYCLKIMKQLKMNMRKTKLKNLCSIYKKTRESLCPRKQFSHLFTADGVNVLMQSSVSVVTCEESVVSFYRFKTIKEKIYYLIKNRIIYPAQERAEQGTILEFLNYMLRRCFRCLVLA